MGDCCADSTLTLNLFHLFDSTLHPVMGLSWLIKHNPHMNWATGESDSLSLTSGRRQAVSPPATTPSQMVKCSDSIMSWFVLPGGLESFLLEQTYNLGRVRS